MMNNLWYACIHYRPSVTEAMASLMNGHPASCQRAIASTLYVGFAGRSIISGLWQGSGQPVHRLGIKAWRRDCGPAPHTLLIRLDGILGRIAPDPVYKVDEQQTLATVHLPYDTCISLLLNADSIYILFIVNTMNVVF